MAMSLRVLSKLAKFPGRDQRANPSWMRRRFCPSGLQAAGATSPRGLAEIRRREGLFFYRNPPQSTPPVWVHILSILSNNSISWLHFCIRQAPIENHLLTLTPSTIRFHQFVILSENGLTICYHWSPLSIQQPASNAMAVRVFTASTSQVCGLRSFRADYVFAVGAVARSGLLRHAHAKVCATRYSSARPLVNLYFFFFAPSLTVYLQNQAILHWSL